LRSLYCSIIIITREVEVRKLLVLGVSHLFKNCVIFSSLSSSGKELFIIVIVHKLAVTVTLKITVLGNVEQELLANFSIIETPRPEKE
jgi:hypothetical protein